MYWTSSSGRIELKMTLEQARSASHQGQCDDDIRELRRVPAIKRQLDKIDPALLAEELKEWGAWSEEERANHELNLDRILWLAACDIREEHVRTQPRKHTRQHTRLLSNSDADFRDRD